jgi:hypothetical protein
VASYQSCSPGEHLRSPAASWSPTSPKRATLEPPRWARRKYKIKPTFHGFRGSPFPPWVVRVSHGRNGLGTVAASQAAAQSVTAPSGSIRPDVAAIAADMTKQLETINDLRIVNGA